MGGPNTKNPKHRAKANLDKTYHHRVGNEDYYFPENDESESIEQSEQPDDIRNKLLENIKAGLAQIKSVDDVDMKTFLSDLAEQFEKDLKDCILDQGGKHETILHWIVNQVDEKKDDKSLIKAAEIMISLAIKTEPSLIKLTDTRNETALHAALTSKKPNTLRLITYMCDLEIDQDAIQTAIACVNGQNENCLHLALKRDTNIAIQLISIASKKAFLQQRRIKEGKQEIPNGGNTPLHDAVDYQRCVIMMPECAKKDPNQTTNCDCRKNAVLANQRIERSIKVVKDLIEKCDEALKKKNAKDESPYLFHLRTKREISAKQNISKTDQEHSTSESSKSCSETPNNKAAAEILNHLTESAFMIGTFEDACSCFFGDEIDDAGKSWPFRPGYPIMSNSYNTYRDLVPKNTSILSHVDLQVSFKRTMNGTSAVSATVDNTISPNVEQRFDDVNEKDVISRWQKSMNSLEQIFVMLRARGVKRILKVTVRDNEHRPCSDRVIQRCLSGFDVRYLDWNKRDISIDIVFSVCPRLTELKLYSSGRRVALNSWTSSEGLCSLHQLTRVRLEAVKGLEDFDSFEKNIALFETRLKQNISLTRWKLFLSWMIELTGYRYQRLEQQVQASKARTDGNNIRKADTLSMQEQKLDILEQEYRRSESQLVELEAQQQDLELESRTMLLKEGESMKATERNQDGTSGPEATSSEVDDDDNPENPLRSMGAQAAEQSVDTTWWYDHEDFTELPNNLLSKSFVTLLMNVEPNVEQDAEQGCYVAWDFQYVSENMERQSTDSNNANKRELKKLIDEGEIAAAMDCHRWLQAIQNFVQTHVVTTSAASDPIIKVALIDDGVDVSQFEGKVNYPGWPPLKPTSSGNLWCHSETGHGTHMARLIQKMCPNIVLYVAKLGDKDQFADDEIAHNASKAVEWAINQEVDIISMSWSLIETSKNAEGMKKLEDQIRVAADKNILLYCAATDKAPYDDDTRLYPQDSDTKHIRIVGSARENGEESSFVNLTQVDYLFPGEGITELDNQKGSSAAAALAAGFSALILWCFRKNPPHQISSRILNPTNMHHVFESLKDPGSKWINVTKMVGLKDIKTMDEVITYCTSATTLRSGKQTRG